MVSGAAICQPEIDMLQWQWDADRREGGGGMAMGANEDGEFVQLMEHHLKEVELGER